MKSAEQIERSLKRLYIEAGAERRERTLSDLVKAHEQHKQQTPASSWRSFGSIMMKRKSMSIAAVIALAVLLIGVFSLGTGSVALSQTQHAVNATLAWLKNMIVGGPASPPGAGESTKQTPDPERREITCAARVFKVSENEQSLWQFLQDQGIELVRVSTDPEVYYATLSPEQAQSFDASVVLKCLATPRVTVPEGESGAIAIHDSTPQGPRGLAVAWLPTISSDGTRIESTISFHDGRDGFEVPNVSTESGGVVLIRAKGMFPDTEPGGNNSVELLMRVQVNIQ